MPHQLTAEVFGTLPGAVKVAHIGDPMTGTIVRLDGAAEAQPVRNFTGSAGAELVIDCEAPLGRPVTYNLLDTTGRVLASAGPVTCPALPNGRGILRSVLRPQVSWMEVEGQDETGVEWATSTTVHRIVGSDTPVVTGEIRQRRSGTMTFLCRSIGEADRLVAMCSDGTLMLVRFDPCANVQVRDLLFYPLDITERRYGRVGWRLVSVEYQATRFVPGDTETPSWDWDFDALAAAAPDFQSLTGMYRTFAEMALGIQNPVAR